VRSAVALMALMTGDDVVYTARRGRRFHEDPECRALGAGHMIFACRCGDPYCGCAADKPPVPEEVSIGTAAMRNLVPCAACYPGFQELAVQLPSDDDFGHVPFQYDGVNICQRCFIERRSFRETVFWPCLSAQILGLAPREESIT
jgi:hypothetical protein